MVCTGHRFHLLLTARSVLVLLRAQSRADQLGKDIVHGLDIVCRCSECVTISDHCHTVLAIMVHVARIGTTVQLTDLILRRINQQDW